MRLTDVLLIAVVGIIVVYCIIHITPSKSEKWIAAHPFDDGFTYIKVGVHHLKVMHFGALNPIICIEDGGEWQCNVPDANSGVYK